MEEPTSTSSRRTTIAQSVIELAAEGGSRAVTHSAIDRRLNLPKGSTSYYCRTRAELLKSGVDVMGSNSRAAFLDFMGTPDSSIAEVTRDYLIHLTTKRPLEVRARLALVAELDPESLRGLFFSHDSAREYFAAAECAHPDTLATGFIDLLEGFLLRSVFAPDRDLTGNEVVSIVDTFLAGAGVDRD